MDVPLSALMKRLLREQGLAFVATVNADGTPNLSPKGTTTVWDATHLVFADLASPGTVRNLKRDPRAEVNVVDPILRKGWRFRVRAEVVQRGPRFAAGVRFFSRQDVEDAPKRIRTIVFLRVLEALPLVSPAYSRGWTEESLRKKWGRHYERLIRRPPHRAARRSVPRTPNNRAGRERR
ncbi:MAG TPA: pyridoxamine 5'-phosphate oxidase family protein [Thermoplasmata archaeon]|nr:pyridoxamine 5'-phosphate oxidase family protein [Thermoplasmata archaeon]